MNRQFWQLELLKSDRQRLISISGLGALLTLVLFGIFLNSSLSWMFSPERYSLNSSESVELISSGRTLEGDSSSEKMLLAHDQEGNPVVVDRYDDVSEVPKGEAFSAWYAPEGSSFTLDGKPDYTSGSEGYYSFKEYLPQIKDPTDALVVVGLSALSTLFIAALFMASILVHLARNRRFNLGVHFPTFMTLVRQRAHDIDAQELRLPTRLGIVLASSQACTILVALVIWGTAPGESSQDYSLILSTFVACLLVMAITALLSFALAELSAVYLFSRFSVRDIGRFSAGVIKPDPRNPSLDAPPWVYRWLENNGWHEETARVLLADFEGTLREICVISKELGPDKDLNQSKLKAPEQLSKV